jgi:hypothetical protein
MMQRAKAAPQHVHRILVALGHTHTTLLPLAWCAARYHVLQAPSVKRRHVNHMAGAWSVYACPTLDNRDSGLLDQVATSTGTTMTTRSTLGEAGTEPLQLREYNGHVQMTPPIRWEPRHTHTHMSLHVITQALTHRACTQKGVAT